jgi:hypothetical protein
LEPPLDKPKDKGQKGRIPKRTNAPRSLVQVFEVQDEVNTLQKTNQILSDFLSLVPLTGHEPGWAEGEHRRNQSLKSPAFVRKEKPAQLVPMNDAVDARGSRELVGG